MALEIQHDRQNPKGIMILPVMKYGDPVLQQVCEPVTRFDEELQTLSKNMVQTMYAAPGYGLAAPQVGVLKRLIVVDDSVGKKPGSLIVLANPEIIDSDGDQYEEEGCLSVPDFTGRVHRPIRVVVSGQDMYGTEKICEGLGLLSRILAHEIDHLDGVMFIDRLGSIRRDMIKRKIRKKVRAGEW
jgi:peptide deformylase